MFGLRGGYPGSLRLPVFRCAIVSGVKLARGGGGVKGDISMVDLEFRKRPVVIQAFQITEGRDQDHSEWPDWLERAWNSEAGDEGSLWRSLDPLRRLHIGTAEGPLMVSPDDWIIRGVQGEIYPCKPDIFAATYEPAGVNRYIVLVGNETRLQAIERIMQEAAGNAIQIHPDGRIEVMGQGEVDREEETRPIVAGSFRAGAESMQDRCLAQVQLAREEGESDMRQVREWIAALPLEPES